MNVCQDRLVLLWGGTLYSPWNKFVIYWAINPAREIFGVVLPRTLWSRLEKALSSSTEFEAPYLTLSIADIYSTNPKIEIYTLDDGTINGFCRLKYTIYNSRTIPPELTSELNKLFDRV